VSVGFFPLDEQLDVRSGQCSEQVARQAVWMYGHTSGAVAVEALKRLAGIVISEASLWRCVERWGTPIQAYEQLRQASANAVPLRGEAGPTSWRSPQNMGVAMDGGMVHVRTEGWKELKVGCVFDVEVRRQGVPETGDVEDYAHAVHNSYLGVLGRADLFGRRLWSEAVQRGVPQAHDSIVIGDGAHWIWDLAQEHFGSSWQVVDWYHAKQHLHQIADMAFGEGSPAGQQWVKSTRTPLFQGQVWRVSASIKELAEEYPSVAKSLAAEAGYFERNKRRMQYLEVRDAGWPIGSGMVESGCKRFGARFDGAGMRWSRVGVERLIPIRAAILSERFDDAWHAALNSPLN
jgi:hypothetical protein